MNYRDIPAVNQSALKHIRKSPLHYQVKLAEPSKPPTDSQLLGQLVHCFMLEPDQYTSRYTILPPFHLDPENVTANGRKSNSKSTNYYESKVEEWRRDNSGKQEVSSAQVAIARKAATGAMRHLPDLFDREVTLTADLNGVACKGRLDVVTNQPAIYDVKTCDNCAEKPFFRLADMNGWPFQMAFYRELLRERTGCRDVVCYWIAVEVGGDFDSVRYEIPDSLVDQAQWEVRRCLALYRECEQSGEWPGVDGGAESLLLTVPNWAMWEGEEFNWEQVA